MLIHSILSWRYSSIVLPRSITFWIIINVFCWMLQQRTMLNDCLPGMWQTFAKTGNVWMFITSVHKNSSNFGQTTVWRKRGKPPWVIHRNLSAPGPRTVFAVIPDLCLLMLKTSLYSGCSNKKDSTLTLIFSKSVVTIITNSC